MGQSISSQSRDQNSSSPKRSTMNKNCSTLLFSLLFLYSVQTSQGRTLGGARITNCQAAIINCCSSENVMANFRCFELNNCAGVNFARDICSYYSSLVNLIDSNSVE